jgi:hypothetical protein
MIGWLLDEVLHIGTVLDWISPLLATVQDLIEGPKRTFLIPYAIDWSGEQIVTWLHGFGVRTWGHMIVDQRIMFTVREAQAEWATWLLEQVGIPFELSKE